MGTPQPSSPTHAAALPGAREHLLATLSAFRVSIEARLPHPEDQAQRRRAAGDGLLGFEMWLKLEEHVLLPALRDDPTLPHRLAQAVSNDSEVVRELIAQSQGAPGLVENAAQRHMRNTESMLRRPEWAAGLDWSRLQREIEAWLERWRAEIEAHGDIEDEERDPVGQPPR